MVVAQVGMVLLALAAGAFGVIAIQMARREFERRSTDMPIDPTERLALAMQLDGIADEVQIAARTALAAGAAMDDYDRRIMRIEHELRLTRGQTRVAGTN